MKNKIVLYLGIGLLVIGGIVLTKKIKNKSSATKSITSGQSKAANDGEAVPAPSSHVVAGKESPCLHMLPSKPLFDEASKDISDVRTSFTDKDNKRTQELTFIGGERWDYEENDCNGITMRLEVSNLKAGFPHTETLNKIVQSPVLTKKGKFFMSFFDKHINGKEKHPLIDGENRFWCLGQCSINIKKDELVLTRDFFPPRKMIEENLKKAGVLK